MGLIEDWIHGERERKKLASKPYDDARLKFQEYLDSLTITDIEVAIDPMPDPKKWALETDGTAWKILSKLSGKIESGDLSVQANSLLDRIHSFSVAEPAHGYFVQGLPFDNSRSVMDPTGNTIRFMAQLAPKHRDAFTSQAIALRKIYNKVKPKPTEPEIEG